MGKFRVQFPVGPQRMNILERHTPLEPRTETALRIIKEVAPSLDKRNVKGIAAFGSFWSPKQKPNDLDLAIYCTNDAIFNDYDRLKLIKPLTEHLGIPVELHLLTPYTPMIQHELHDYRIFLREANVVWGKMPAWLNIESDKK